MGQVIVVTGCSSGFGRQVSEMLARRGDRVYATMRASEKKNSHIARDLRAMATREKLDLHVIELDVASANSVDAAAAMILSEAGAPDVVINNAGQMFVGITEAFTAEELTRQLDINVVGVHRVNRAFLPAMRKRGKGLIINISSIAGRVATPFFGIYHASKWALEGYSLAMRCELASSGIDVTVVEPGPFGTALFRTSPAPADADKRGKTYPDVVHTTFESAGAAFDSMLKDPAMPTDPTLVAQALIDVIDQAPGTRSFRQVVGIDLGVKDHNAGAAVLDAAVLATFGMTEFAKLRV